MTPERQKPGDPYGHLIVTLEATLLRQRPKDPLIPEIFAIQNRKQLMDLIDSLHNKPLDKLYERAGYASLFDELGPEVTQHLKPEWLRNGKGLPFDPLGPVWMSLPSGERVANFMREQIRENWTLIRNKICQSRTLENLKKGKYDNYSETLKILVVITDIFTDQPLTKTFAIATASLKIASRNLDRFCTKAGLNFDEMEKAVKTIESEQPEGNFPAASR